MFILLCILLSIVVIPIVFLYFFPIVQICGYSMYPTLIDGTFFLGRKVIRKDKCKVGEIYVYRPPYADREERFVIKRLASISKDASGNVTYYFLGDNPYDSYDSRFYGNVDSKNIVAHIVLKKRGVDNGVQEN